MSVGQHNDGPVRPGQAGSQARTDQSVDVGVLKEDLGEIAGVAVERGRHFLDSARLQATSYADKRKDDAAQSVADLAQSLRDTCKAFDDRPNIRAFVDSAAEGLDQLSDTIRSRSFSDIYGDLEEVMRRRPGTVAAATMVAGFALSRFIRASAENLRETQSRQGRTTRAAGRGSRAGARTAQHRA